MADGEALVIGTLAEMLEVRADEHSDQVVYSYFSSRHAVPDEITAGRLRGAARVVGSSLRRHTQPGDRVVLALPPGIDFVSALFGCAYAGTVVVPVAESSAPRLANDCGAAVVIGREDIGTVHGVQTISVKTLMIRDGPGRDPISRQPDDLAVLQYSSGSTASPKGVMVSNANLVANLRALQHHLELDPGADGVVWLPPSHDMGLIGGIFLPLYHAGHVSLMSPRQFAGKPIRWLEMLSSTRAGYSAIPNFALDLCVRSTTDEERRRLDLSNLRTLLLGGEPVREVSLRRFREAFEAAGFRPDRFTAAYGLAEHTLLVTATEPHRAPKVISVCATALSEGLIEPPRSDRRAISIVSSGSPPPGTEIAIVDIDQRCRLPSRRVGEIWVRGPSVALGYWNQAELTEHTFGGVLTDCGSEPFLRTGDLGFQDEGHLYVTGRTDDLLILNGANHNAELLESSVAAAHPDLRPEDCVVCTVDQAGSTELVVVIGLSGDVTVEHESLVAAVRSKLTTTHLLSARRVLLTRRRALPRTPNGKLQRERCRRLVADAALPVVYEWRAPTLPSPVSTRESVDVADSAGSVAALTERIAVVLGLSVDRVDPDVPLGSLGLDSLHLAELLIQVEVELGRSIDVDGVTVDATVSTLAASFGAGGMRLRAHAPTEPQTDLADLPELVALQERLDELGRVGLANPFRRRATGVSGTRIDIDGRSVVDFASYNYLGLSGSAAVNDAARAAILRYGTSASASRVSAGERDIHHRLERALASFLGTEAAIVFVSGNLTNVTCIGHLVGPGDLVVHDTRVHDSVINGARLSGAVRRGFPHNDWATLDRLLSVTRRDFRRVLIVVEGLYSMDGDAPDLGRFVEVKQRHGAFLMVDEAHSLGVLGATGRGIAEHQGIDRSSVEIWMGTLSKALAGCGGYIAGSQALVDYLRYSAPGYVYSVGLSPPDTAAALAAIEEIDARPELVSALSQRTRLLFDVARAKGLPIPTGAVGAIAPVIVGSSLSAVQLSNTLFDEGFNVLPIVHPAVPEGVARLRLFVRADHQPTEIESVVDAIARLLL